MRYGSEGRREWAVGNGEWEGGPLESGYPIRWGGLTKT